jgi:hypothetical protein
MLGVGNCCCNSPTCTIVAAATAFDLGDYTQVSGSWSLTYPPGFAGGLILTSSADALIVHNTPHPEGLSIGAVGVGVIRIPAAGATQRLLLCYLDPDNHLFIEWRTLLPGPTAGIDISARLGYRQGGVDTFLDNAWPAVSSVGTGATTERYLTRHGLCYDGNRLSSGINFGSPATFGADCPISGLTLGAQVGFQVIGNGGSAGFGAEGTSFHLSFSGENSAVGGSCALCHGAAQPSCDPVLSGTPREYSVYLTGVANNTCGACTTLFNGATFVIDEPYASTGIRGEFYKSFAALPAACTGLNNGILINYGTDTGTSPNAFVTLRIGMPNGDGRFTFDKTANLCNEVLTDVGGFNLAAFNFLTQRCNWTGATAQITPNVM